MFLNWNKDTVQDEVILNHLVELSDNKLKVKEEDLPLMMLPSLKLDRKQWFKNNHKQRNKEITVVKILIRSFHGSSNRRGHRLR